MFFLCKQKTAYEMRISDWSSDVCSSDLSAAGVHSASSTRCHRNSRHCGFRWSLTPSNDVSSAVSAALTGEVRHIQIVKHRVAVTTFTSRSGGGRVQRGEDSFGTGRASCREKGCRDGSIPVVAV